MRSARVVYVGPALAGRATSLAVLLSTIELRVDPLTLDPYRTWNFVFGETEVAATISVARASRVYGNASDIGVDPHVAWEVDRLMEADGIVFVADSQRERLDVNRHQLEKLRADLQDRRRELTRVPVVLQANKCDLPSALSVDQIKKQLGTEHWPAVESVATAGRGPAEALRMLVELIESNRNR